MKRTLHVATLSIAALLAACSPPQGEIDAHPDGVLAVVEEGGGRLTTLDAASGATIHSTRLDSLPHEVEIAGDGRTAYVSNFGLRDYDLRIGEPGRSIAIIDLQDGTLKGHLWLSGDSLGTTGARAPHGVKLRPPDKRELYTNAEVGDSMVVFDVATRRRVRAFPVPAGTHNFIFTADGKTLWLMAADSGVYRMDPDSGTVTGRIATSTPIRGLDWMPGGFHLLASGRGELLIINPDSLSIERRLDSLAVGQIIYSAATLDGSYLLAPAPLDSVVVVVNRLTGKVEHRLHTGVSPIRVLLDPTGSRAYVANAEDDHVTVINLGDWSMRSLGEVDEPNGLALVP